MRVNNQNPLVKVEEWFNIKAKYNRGIASSMCGASILKMKCNVLILHSIGMANRNNKLQNIGAKFL